NAVVDADHRQLLAGGVLPHDHRTAAVQIDGHVLSFHSSSPCSSSDWFADHELAARTMPSGRGTLPITSHDKRLRQRLTPEALLRVRQRERGNRSVMPSL